MDRKPSSYPPELAEWYAHTGRLVSRAAADRARAGNVVGRIPLGYLPSFDGEELLAVPDPERAPIIAEAFLLASAPRSSLRSVLEEVTAKGLRNHGGRPLGKSALHVILTNPFYAGVVRHKGEEFPGRHEAVVGRALFDRVQARLWMRKC